MFKQVLKIIWNQRWQNGWIYGELMVVTGVLWLMCDYLLLSHTIYSQPLGYDTENCWQIKLGNLNSNAEGYTAIDPEQHTETETRNLLLLMDRLRLQTEIEEVCASFFSCPYSQGNSWNSLEPADADTTTMTARSYQVRRVTPEYFTLFRIRDKQGNLIRPDQLTGLNSIVISEDLETDFFGETTIASSAGRKVRRNHDAAEMLVSAICQPIRMHDYKVSNPCFFEIRQNERLADYVETFSASRAEVSIRTKRHMSSTEIAHLLESMGEQLTVGNLYVYGYTSFAEKRALQITGTERQEKIRISLMVFMMINVFFGIVGTFWMRTQSRKGEMGLRVALGSTRAGLFWVMNIEGLSLFLLTLPPVMLLLAHLIYFDLVVQTSLPLSFVRVLTVSAGTFLLMAGMICLGIWFPAKNAVSISAADALHYE